MAEVYDAPFAFLAAPPRSIQKPTPMAMLNLLMAIESEAATTITDLAEILAMDRTTLTRNLKLLRDRGLVEKTRISLTAKGRRSAAAALPLWERAQQQFLKGLGTRRWAALLDELAAARASLQSRSK